MRIICKSIADTQFLSNNSFIYLWESFLGLWRVQKNGIEYSPSDNRPEFE